MIPERAISMASMGKIFAENERKHFAPKELQSPSEYRTNLRTIKKCYLFIFPNVTTRRRVAAKDQLVI